jgi:hypothetical protein
MPELNPTDEIIDTIVAVYGNRIRTPLPDVTPQGKAGLSGEERRRLWPYMNAAQRGKMRREQGSQALIDLGRKEQ